MPVRRLMERCEVGETVIRFAMIQLKAERLVYGQQDEAPTWAKSPDPS
ncbi:hypothetical protein ACN27G_04560 [Plantactinospora sp. WMMB334]